MSAWNQAWRSIWHAAPDLLPLANRVASQLWQLLRGNRRWRPVTRESLALLPWGQRYLAHHFTRSPSRMHRWLAELLDMVHQRRGTKINVIGPRGGAKSTVVTLAYTLRTAVEGWEPYIWIVSDTMEQAHTHLGNIKAELEENQRLIEDYPLACCDPQRWTASSITLGNGTTIEAFGTGQALRGRRMRQHRPTLIVCDDLQNDSHMQSSLQRESSSDWFHGTLLKAGTKHTNFINLATALHRDALAMQLDQTPGWISQKFRAIERWPRNMDLWRQWEKLYTGADAEAAQRAAQQFFDQQRADLEAGAQLLWPDEEDLLTLMKMRVEAGHAAFEREKQSSPFDPARCEWPDDYFADHLWIDHWPDELRLVAVALDPSKGSDARHGDYSAFVVVGVDPQGLLIVDADLARRPVPQIVADGVALCRRVQADAFGVEANQFQELLADEFTAEFARQGITTCRPCAIHNFRNKLLRIRRLGPYLSKRRLRFVRNSPGARLAVDQLRDFPLGTHDDGPDALEMALRLVEQWHDVSETNDGLGSRLPVGD